MTIATRHDSQRVPPAMKPPPQTILRRSMRIKGLSAAMSADDIPGTNPPPSKRKRAPKQTKTGDAAPPKKAQKRKAIGTRKSDPNSSLEFLPRTREQEVQLQNKNINVRVIGVDEAGRGPLAGPVVAAAAIIPTNIPGVADSKKITKEEVREDLYEKIISSPNARWAVAVADARRIDEINILQATLEAMRKAVEAIISLPIPKAEESKHKDDCIWKTEHKISSKIDGCFVISGMNDNKGSAMSDLKSNTNNGVPNDRIEENYALIDGNRIPKDMPCEAESMVKGDSREYAIAAASILAKVSRDRLMHEYDVLYPAYDLAKHKGYPTAAHMVKVKQLGASPIHRRTFAPLKHMTFDENGTVVEDNR